MNSPSHYRSGPAGGQRVRRGAQLVLVAGSMLLLAQSALASPSPPTSAPLQSVTNQRSQYSSFNPEVIRGLAFDTTLPTTRLFSIHAYSSTLVRFDLGATHDPKPSGQWRTLADPVSVVFEQGYVFVVGQGNHAIAKHDPNTGEMLEVLNLPSEPADIVVDSQGHAWISCMNADSVVEVQLTPSLSLVNTWGVDEGLELKRPRFLALDPGTPGVTPERVLIAPFLSGNGSFASRKTNDNLDTGDRELAPEAIHDGYDTVRFGSSYGLGGTPSYGVLPDEDLFAINVGTTAPAYAVARTVSTLMTGHGYHPSGDYWMLGIELENADPAKQTEPDLNGSFAVNELNVISGGLPAAGTLAVPGVPIDVDEISAGTYDPTGNRALSFPYALTFGTAFGLDVAAIAGSTTPNVSLLTSSGQRAFRGEMRLDTASFPGKVPRDLAFHDNELYIYCQETGNILAWPLKSFAGAIQVEPDADREYQVGIDPAPDAIARGRSVWYDAKLSLNGRVSCNTCHPGGEADGLAWSLTDDRTDFKDLMVTQTMKGALDAFPFHWRGERDLEDFNGAFVGLLGGASVLDTDPAAEFGLEDFQSFIFSLQPAANPKRPLNRRLNANAAPYAQPNGIAGNPVDGFKMFRGIIDFAGNGQPSDCRRCHQPPTGSIGFPHRGNNTNLADSIHNFSALNRNIETATLHNMNTIRDQITVPFVDSKNTATTLDDAVYKLPLLGFGRRHNGVNPTIHDFLADQFLSSNGPLNAANEANAADMGAFLDLFDSGTAPASHFTQQLVAGPGNTAQYNSVKDTLIAQADFPKRWIDIAVLGISDGPNGLRTQSWWYDPALEEFVCEDTQVPNAVLTDFRDSTGWSNFFLACLPGHGKRLGIDYDDDDLTNYRDAINLDPFDPDFDKDGLRDGYEFAQPSLDPNDGSDAGNNSDNTAPALIPAGTTGPELDFVTASLAKFHFETSEPVTWEMTASNGGRDPDVECFSNVLATRHTAVMRNLKGSGAQFTTSSGANTDPPIALVPWDNDYTLELTITDQNGNPRTYIVNDLQTSRQPTTKNGAAIVVGGGSLTEISFVGNQRKLLSTTNLRDLVDENREVGDGHILALQVLKRPTGTQKWEFMTLADIAPPAVGTYFLGETVDVEVADGPTMTIEDWYSSPMFQQNQGALLLLPPTTAAQLGVVQAEITVVGAATMGDIAVQVIAVFDEPAGGFDPANLLLKVPGGDFSLPLTAPENRIQQL